MHQALFGELLGRIVPLSGHDVCEILEEQARSGRRFGRIALGWDLCEPTHLWQVWSDQLAGRTPRVDLSVVGIDAQATSHVPGRLAAAWGVVPVRALPGGLVVAASEQTLPRAADGLAARLGRAVNFVLSDSRQIEQALRTYYPAAAAEHALARGCAARTCVGDCAGAACHRRRTPTVLSLAQHGVLRDAC